MPYTRATSRVHGRNTSDPSGDWFVSNGSRYQLVSFSDVSLNFSDVVDIGALYTEGAGIVGWNHNSFSWPVT